jgi:hypothetical protein
VNSPIGKGHALLAKEEMLLLLCACVVVAKVNLARYQRLAHDTLFMGEHRHPRNASKTVQGYAFLHYHSDSDAARAQSDAFPPVGKSNHFKRANVPPLDRCAMPLADGAVWKTSRGYFINTLNAQQLSPAFLETTIARALRKWNCALDDRLVIGPLLGLRTNLDGNAIQIETPDGVNEIGLGTIVGRPGTIAFTVLYGIFSGPIEDRELTNFKMVFDESKYRFGDASVRSGVIDFESTATHEAGHVFGLDDIYSFSCADVTMFATSEADETKKRTLEGADIVGVQTIYQK